MQHLFEALDHTQFTHGPLTLFTKRFKHRGAPEFRHIVDCLPAHSDELHIQIYHSYPSNPATMVASSVTASVKSATMSASSQTASSVAVSFSRSSSAAASSASVTAFTFASHSPGCAAMRSSRLGDTGAFIVHAMAVYAV